jgi:hypothetical protein
MFKELLAALIADTFTPWQWENYVPYPDTTHRGRRWHRAPPVAPCRSGDVREHVR